MKNGLSAIKRAFTFAFALGISSLVAPANAAPDLSHCTDNSRECLVASAMSYINALIGLAPAASMRLSTNVRRTLEGARFPEGFVETVGDSAMRSGLGPPDPADPQLQKRLAERKLTFQEYLAQQTQYKEIKKYIIQTIVVDERAGQVVIVWGGATEPKPGKSMERFKIVKGLITEIESLDIDRKFTDNTLGWPAVQPCLRSGDGRLVPCNK
jgi:hypothetical protein